MPITIEIKDGVPHVYNSYNRRHEPVVSSNFEIEAMQIIEKIITDAGLDFNKIHLERRSDNYLSLVIGEHYDFCRIKVTARTTWFSLDLLGCVSKLSNDVKLSDVKNKNQRHWKIPLNEVDDLINYSDYVIMSFKDSEFHSNQN